MPHIPRREFLKRAGASAALTALPLTGGHVKADSSAPARPNILVFLTDDHGQWAQHAYGNSEINSPNLDRLAARGVRMTRAFTPCPVCSPARASFFTGRMPSQHGIHDWIEETKHAYTHPGLRGQTTLPELLKAAGYHTGLVGKWHCGREREVQPGFDRWFGYWLNQYPHDGTQQFSDQGNHITEQGPQSPCFTKRAVEFIRSHKEDAATAAKPFFLFVGYVDTHSPHKDAPPELVEPYHAASFRDIPDEKFAACHGSVMTGMAANPQAEHERRAQYYGAVSSVDREVGKVITELEATGQLDNTLIVYTGDHGLNTGHHGIWEKGNATTPQNFLDESILIACTFAWPAGGIRQNATCDDIVNHCDLWATLLEIAGASPDPAAAKTINSPGRSYLPQLRGHPPTSWPDAQISEYGNARMIRTARYKLILRYPYAGVSHPSELYDLQADRRETINRYDDVSLAAIVKDLTARLNEFFGKYSVPEHDGLGLENQPECTPASPWLRGVKKKPN